MDLKNWFQANRWIPVVWVCLFFVFGNSGFSQNADELKLESELKSARSDTQKLRLYTELNWLYLFENKPKAREFAQKQINLAAEKGLKKELAQGYNDMGLVFNVESDFVSALEWHKKALAIRREINDANGIASSLSKIGVCQTELHRYTEALNAQFEALRIFEKAGNESAQAQTLGNLCALAVQLKDLKQLEKFASQALILSQKTKSKTGELQALSYLATLEESRGNVSEAVAINQKIAAEYKANSDTLSWISALNNLGYEYEKLGENSKSKAAFQQAYTMAEAIYHPADIVRFATNLAILNLKQKQIAEAESLLKRAESVGKQESITENFPELYRTWGDFYLETNQKEKAKEAYTIAAQFQDSLSVKELGENYNLLQTIYETDKREKEKQLLSKENELQSGQLQLQRTGIWLGLSLLVLMAVVLLMAYQRKVINQKRAEELFRHLAQEQRAKAVLEAEEQERKRIARDLHDGIGQQLAVATMNLSILETDNPDQKIVLDNVKSLVEDATKELRSVSHTLLSNALLRSGLAGAVREFVQKIQGPVRINLEVSGLENRLEQTTELVLFRVVQELMGNILKHAQATEVYIQLFVEDGRLFLLVEDNGIGFQSAAHQRPEGVGLRNIQSRIDYLNGRFDINGKPGSGTSIVVEVPALFVSTD